jgi:predicted small lipoprotein YifL
MRRISFILAALIFSFLTVACGQKGALKLPAETPAPGAKPIAPDAGK